MSILLTIHGGRDGDGPGCSGVGMTQGKREFLQTRAKFSRHVHLRSSENSPVHLAGEIVVPDDDVMRWPARCKVITDVRHNESYGRAAYFQAIHHGTVGSNPWQSGFRCPGQQQILPDSSQTCLHLSYRTMTLGARQSSTETYSFCGKNRTW